MLSALTILASESGESGGVSPYLIGGVTLVILMGMLLALISFGGGREHS